MRAEVSLLLALAAMAPGAAAAQPAGVSPRLLPTPAATGASVTLQDFVTLPKQGGAPARVQFLAAAPDGTTDLFAIDEYGLIYRIGADGKSVSTYLDLRAQGVSLVSGGGEEGLVGLAFHPDFLVAGAPGYGRFYTAFSAAKGSGTPDFLAAQDQDHDQVIREWTAANPKAAAFAGTSREVLRVGKYASNHNGGVIRFNPNAPKGDPDYGKLYIGFGDGGAGNDPNGNGQNVQSPLGKILRIDPLPGAGGARYAAPADNPFPTGGLAAPLVWALGLRNPQQFSFERGPGGRMFIDDIGQNQVEEVDLGFKGGNYGWQEREGAFATGTGAGVANPKSTYASYPRPPSDGAAAYVYPIAQFDHVDRDTNQVVSTAIGSGFVYQGTQVPELAGQYVFTDFAQGRLYSITAGYGLSRRARPVSLVAIVYKGVSYDAVNGSPAANGGRADFRLGDDANGELYALVKATGSILRVVATP